MDKETFEKLLNEGESNKLDYKSDQYTFISSRNHEKSELLKDILAFANAWRTETAHILIGVEETKNGKGIAVGVGVTKHFDDAVIQEFVNKKLNRPISFSYTTFDYNNLSIGVFEIHTQLHSRPFYIEKDFGKIKRHEVKVRRGTSTDTAEPDEVKQMGLNEAEERKTPTALISIANHETKEDLGDKVTYNNELLEVPSETDIPSYRAQLYSMSLVNTQYLRQYAKYCYETSLLRPVLIKIMNTGKVTLKNSRVEINHEKSPTLLIAPNVQGKPPIDYLGPSVFPNMYINVEDRSTYWSIELKIDDVQPQASSFSGPFYVGAVNQSISFECNLYADNLEKPIKSVLTLEFNTKGKTTLSLEKLKSLAEK